MKWLKKLVKLETVLSEFKSVQTKSEPIIEQDSSVKNGEQSDPTDKKEIKTSENKKEVLANPRNETLTMAKPLFKCDTCGAIFKKEITLKKHYNIKHEVQNC